MLTSPIGQLRVGSVASLAGGQAQRYSATDLLGKSMDLGIVLWSEQNNSSSVVIEGQNLATAVGVNLIWREILLEPSWNA